MTASIKKILLLLVCALAIFWGIRLWNSRQLENSAELSAGQDPVTVGPEEHVRPEDKERWALMQNRAKLKRDMIKRSVSQGGEGENAPGQRANEKPEDPLLMEALKRAQEGDNAGSLRLLQELYQKDPTNAQVLEELAVHYLEREGDFDKANKYLDELLKVDKENPLAITEKAFLLEDTYGPEESEKFLYEHLEKNPDSSVTTSALANTLMSQGKLAQAAPLLEKNLQNSPTPDVERQDLAHIYLQLGNFSKAQEHYQLGLEEKKARIKDMQSKGQASEEEENETQQFVLDYAYDLAKRGKCQEARETIDEDGRDLTTDPYYKTMLQEIESCH